MTNEELFSVAEIVDRLVTRFHKQAADHETKMVEHRAAFGARTVADTKIIAGLREELNQVRNSLGIQAAKEANKVLGMVDGEGLRGAAERVVKERDGLLTQVQDMRAEVERLRAENRIMKQDAEDGYANAIKVLGDPIQLAKERDALRAEVADLRRTMTAVHDRLGIAVGENILKAEIERLKKPTRQHPVAVGEWVRRTSGGDTGRMAQVKSHRRSEPRCVGLWRPFPILQYDVQIDGYKAFWASSNCEPCDPPTEATHDTPDGRSVAESVIRDDRNTEPKPGDTVRLIQIPIRDAVSPELQTTLAWPWIERWGTLNQTALVVEPAYQLDGALSVCLSTNVHVRWPISCIEVITEATHDTEAGKAAAQNAEKTEQVADEIKVGDVVEVVSNRGRNTWLVDVGSFGIVTSVEYINDSISVHLDDVPGKKKNALVGCVSFCDVRKVTT